jgi:hypothetical protein
MQDILPGPRNLTPRLEPNENQYPRRPRSRQSLNQQPPPQNISNNNETLNRSFQPSMSHDISME